MYCDHVTLRILSGGTPGTVRRGYTRYSARVVYAVRSVQGLQSARECESVRRGREGDELGVGRWGSGGQAGRIDKLVGMRKRDAGSQRLQGKRGQRTALRRAAGLAARLARAIIRAKALIFTTSSV